MQPLNNDLPSIPLGQSNQTTTQPAAVPQATAAQQPALRGPLAGDTVSFSGNKSESPQPSLLQKCLAFAAQAGQGFKAWERVSDPNAKFSFMNAKPSELNPNNPSEPYHKSLMVTSTEAMKSSYGKESATPDEVYQDQKAIFEEGMSSLPSTEEVTAQSEAESAAFVEQLEQVKQGLPPEKQQAIQAKIDDYKAKSSASRQEYAEKREQLLKTEEQKALDKMRKFSDNWAALDGDASTVSKKDMAIYLETADAQDGTLDGKFTKAEEVAVAGHIANNGSAGLEKFIDNVNKNASEAV